MLKVRRILCPLDFSPTSARAASYAAEFARAFGAELVLLHVIPALEYPLRSFGMASAFPHLRDDLHTRAAEALQQERMRLGADLKIEVMLRDGEAHAQAIDCAKSIGADLIVVGTHGHTGIVHAILGSTAERIVRLAQCPVLTVRSKE